MSKKICRLCLGVPTVYFSVLEKGIPTMLEKLTSIRVVEFDQVAVTCIKCFLNLKLAYNIQQKILRADERIRKNDLPVLNTVKLEITEEILEDCKECKAPENQSPPEEPSAPVKDEGSSSTDAILPKPRLRKKYVMRCKQPDPEGPFQCDVCYKKYDTKHKFQNHSHEKKKCPVCEAEISKSNFKKHVSNHSSGPQTCELCGATLCSLESLRGHMSHTHSTRTFCCEDCGQIFKKRYQYLIHMKKHKGEKNHVCDTCGKSFFTHYALKKHIQGTHMKLRPHICKYCQKAFSSRFAMRTHERQHTNETPYRCPICGDGFRQNVSLKAHKRSKHNIEEPLTAACTVCGKEFASEHAVISHMRLH